MSYHIPSNDEEERTLWETGYTHRCLDERDNPYGLVVDPTLGWYPPPLWEGQIFCSQRRSRKHGPVERRTFLKAIVWGGRLEWAHLRLGPWL
jgi:hypothetical protein